ncbi:hypothetical protein OPQ81_001339 [Rhizoctonia solani]|nr:hypothetical protein OPQ81_001339 [Rhizoctonia solani]
MIELSRETNLAVISCIQVGLGAESENHKGSTFKGCGAADDIKKIGYTSRFSWVDGLMMRTTGGHMGFNSTEMKGRD